MKKFTQTLTLMGTVVEKNAANGSFTIRCRTGDTFEAYIKEQTSFQVVQNLDGLNNDRVPDPPQFDPRNPSAEKLVEKYVDVGRLLVVQGIRQVNDANSGFDARTIYLLASDKDSYLFEETNLVDHADRAPRRPVA